MTLAGVLLFVRTGSSSTLVSLSDGADGADGADGVDGVDGDRTEGMRWWEQSRSNAHTAQTGQRWTWTLALSTNCR